MRLRPEQLPARLKQGSLAAVYLLSGDEPLQVIEAADAVRARARAEGFAERDVLDVHRHFDWNELSRAGANLSLFSQRRIIELRLGSYSPGRDGGPALVDFCARRDTDTLLLITAERLDKKALEARWARAVDEVGVIIQVWPVEAAQLPAWIAKRMERHGKRMDDDAAELIAQRVEGNLLAASQEVDKLALLVDAAHITLDDIARAVTDSTRYDVFAMLDAGMAGNGGRVTVMLRGLRQEDAEPVAVLGACMFELRRFCAMAAAVATDMTPDQAAAKWRIRPQHLPAVRAALKRIPAQRAYRFLREAAHVERTVKGATRLDPWLALETFLLRIAGIGIESPLVILGAR